MTAIARLAPVSHPFDGLRLVMEVAKSDSLLAREQHDVIVRHAQLNGIAEERDFVRRIRCELLEGLEDPESFDGEEGLRRAHVHEDARAAVLLAFEDDCTKKPSRFLGGFPFEQFRPPKTAFHRDLVLHSLWGAPPGPLFSIHPPLGRWGLAPHRKRPPIAVVVFADPCPTPPEPDAWA